MADQFEPGIADQMKDIVLTAGEKIIEAEKVMPFGKQTLAEMGTQKSGAAGNQYAHFKSLQEYFGCSFFNTVRIIQNP